MDLSQHYGIATALALLLSAGRALPVLIARRHPRPTGWLSLGAVVVTAAVATPVSSNEPWPWAISSVLSYAAVLALVGTALTNRRAVLELWLLSVAAGAGLAVAWPSRAELPGTVVAAVCFGLVLIAADAIRGRRHATQKLVAVEQVIAAERGERMLLEERARIARDLHDIVAHHMSVVAVQAESAPFRLDGVGPEVAVELAQIAAEARRAINDMRQVLAVLRFEPSGDGPRHPQPGLADLPELVTSATRGGVVADLGPVPESGSLGAVMEMAVYRIVQEALSNVVRHAPGATAEVRISTSHGPAVISIRNSPVATRPPRSPGGHGLLGIRERVGLLGGELRVGATPEGGWVVEATIPLRGDWTGSVEDARR